MRNFYIPAILCAAFLLPLQGSADAEINSVELLLSDIELKPGNVIKLKSLALKSQPDIAIDNIQLVAVEILGKSKQGKGKFRLRVGAKLSNWTTLGGTMDAYSSDKAKTFSTAKIRSPAMGKKQVWQLLVNGYIKVRKIILYTTAAQGLPDGSV